MAISSDSKAALSAQVESIERQLEKLQAKARSAESKLNAAREEVDKKRAYNARAVAETQKLDGEINSSGVKAAVEQLLPLVRKKASLAAEEKAFKSSCKEKRTRLEHEIEGLRVNPPEPGADDAPDELETEQKRVTALRDELQRELSEKLRGVYLLERKLDEVPSGLELIQYEKRFVELYEQEQRKLQETRRLYNTYNVLTNVSKFTQKEASLLNSIDSQFDPAISFPAGRAKLVESMEGIATSVKQTLSRATQKLEEERKSVAALQAQHAQLLEAERLYYTRVKELQVACDRNEELRQNLEGTRTAA